MKRRFFLVPSILLILGCGLITQIASPTETAPDPTLAVPSDTPSFTATAEIATTLPPTATLAPVTAPTSAQGSGLPAFYTNLNNVQQYFNPNGAPVKTWNGVPVMPQAIAGQDFNHGVYSYKATATLKQAVAFYNNFSPAGAPSMPMGSGSAGKGSNAMHNATFLYPNMIIYLASYDNDTSHVIVVISVQQ